MGPFGEKLLGRLQRSRRWPLPEEADHLKKIGLWIALRESIRERLKFEANQTGWPQDNRKHYMADPLPRRISDAFSSLIFGRMPKIKTAADSDQPFMDTVIEENQLGPELKRGVQTSSSEGEVWWRIWADREIADAPLIEWFSRTAVVPHWVGRKLVAIAFVSRLDESDENSQIVYRHFEIHEVGSVTNVLFRGNDTALGGIVPLTEREETADLEEEWNHGLPGMLAGRIVNLEGVDPKIGISDYDDILDYLFELNEVLATGAGNRKKTLKSRVVVPAHAVDAEGQLKDDEVLIADDVNASLGEGVSSASPYKVLEYSFDAAALIAYKRDLIETALGRVGIDAQFVSAGDPNQGFAASGTALRVRLLPTTAAGEDRAQSWDDQLPKILTLVQLVDTMPVDEGGFGRSWQNPGEPPSVTRGSTLPEDEIEETARLGSGVNDRIVSRQTAVRELHPDWSDEQVLEELDRINNDMIAERPLGGGSILGEFGETDSGDSDSGNTE